MDVKTAHNGVMADADAFNRKVHLGWVGVGTAEGRMYDGIKATTRLGQGRDQERVL